MKMLSITIVAGLLLGANAHAARTTISGKIVNVQMMAVEQIPGTNNPKAGFSFELNPRPALAPGVVFARFSITTDTTMDEEIRKSIISTVLFAYASDKTVSVSYDDAGAFIDNRMFGIYYVTVRD